jgi:hypothetical protein
MKNILKLLAITFVLLPVSSMAGRGGGFSYEQGAFWYADQDKNQRLDRDEAKAVHNLSELEIFARFDEDSNGFINRAEFREFLQLSPWVGQNVHPKDK